jgi:hypothetical protein
MTQKARRRTAVAAVGMALLVGMMAVGDPGGGPLAMAGPVPPPTSAMVLRAPAPTPTLTPTPTPVLRTGLAEAAVQAAAAAAGAPVRLAVAVLDRGTGEIAVGATGAAPVLTASLSKMVVAVDVLDRRRLEGLAVTEADLALLHRALAPSDDDAMSALWSRFGGAGAAARLSARLGLAATSGPDDPSQWGEMRASAVDTVKLWAHVLDGMLASDRDFLISAMEAAPARAADGFDQEFGLLDTPIDGPGGPGAVAKQGWMCCFSGTYYVHSAGAVGADQRFVVALLTQQPRGPGWEAAREALDRIALAAVAPLR